MVSVIIPCYNAAPWIREALESVAEQGVEDMEIIVIDDGSTDNSAALVEDGYPDVHLIRAEHQGPSRARQIGTEKSKGEFIQYLDADDLLAPGKIKLQLEILKNSGADIAYGNWQRMEEAKNGEYVKTRIDRAKLDNPQIDLLTTSWCALHAYLFTRTIVEKIGGWNERLPVIQDAWFALDCALHGARFVYCPGIMCYYRIRSSDSISTRGPIDSVHDYFKIIAETEKWWKKHGGIDRERKSALLNAYGYIARASFDRDSSIFETAYKALERLKPGYLPPGPSHFKLASILFGYRNAERIASFYRGIKKFTWQKIRRS